MMESLIRKFYSLFFLVLFSSWVAAVRIENPWNEEIKKQTLDSLMGKLCPPFGLGVRYEVAMIQTAKTMFGYTYLEYNRTISAAPLFNLWLKHPRKTSNRGHCKDIRNMDHFAFECISKQEASKKEEISKGWHCVTILDHSQPSISQDNNNLVFRCAVYEVNDAPAQGVKIIRMAISAPSKEQMHKDLCDSLSIIMAKDDPTYISKGHRIWPDGSMYLYMLGKPALDGPVDSMKYPTSHPMKSTTKMPLTTIQTTTNSIRTTRYDKKLMEYLDSRTTTTKIPDFQDVFDYLYLFVNGREQPSRLGQ